MNNEKENTGSFKANEFIEYSDKSVVSKTIIKKPSGNITLFAFDKGEGLAEHSSPHEAFVQIIDGTAEINIGGTIHKLSSGECIILPADIPHSLLAADKFKMILTMIKN